jgi:murein DD-endopeptidase MepM/ murein hydrolase activator NlpD
MATVKVKKGDTLSKIAQNAGISLSALLKLNPQIKNPNLINPGQVVTISKPTPAKPAAPVKPTVDPTARGATAPIDAAKAYALSPAGMREAADKIIAEEAARKARIESDPDVIAARKNAAEAAAAVEKSKIDIADAEAALAATKAANAASGLTPKPKQPGTAWTWDGTKWVKPNIPDASKTYTWDDNKGWLLPEEVEVVEAAGDYTFDVKTGILLFNGKPYTGTYNGFDYEGGNKKDPTVGKIIDRNTDPLDLEGPTDAELARLDAFEQLKGLFESYNLGSLAGKITEYMKAGKGPNETVLLLKKSDEYNLRFQGNTLRLAAGLNVMSESDYLELEDSYAETLTRYGLRGMLSTDRTKNEAMFAKYMGNDLAGPEFKSRIELATDRVINADPGTKETFKKFFPNITDADLVSYFLSPKDTLSKLQEKATTAEIGSVALSQGLTTSLTSATDLAKFGVDRAAAVQGYAAIKEVLPTSQKLGSIYDEAGIKYDQASGEAEFLKLNEDARLKRKRLESLERGSFSGSSGMAASALRKSSTAGQV